MVKLPYRSPIDRDLLAQIIRILNDAEARAIALDIRFDQRTEPDKDDNLIAAIREFSGPIVIAWADARAGITEDQSAWLAQFR